MSSVLKAPLRHIAGVLRALSARAMLQLANRSRAEGLTIVDLTIGQQASPMFETVETALRMIRERDPIRFERIRRDVRRIAVMQSFGSAGEYWGAYNAVALDIEHLKNEKVESICMTIVHEATHARIERWGVRADIDPGRVERACVDQEIAFARKLPGSKTLIKGAEMKLQSEWWLQRSDSRTFDLRLEGAGTPKWLRKVLVWVHR